MKIAIATPTLIEGDAVGNDVLGMARTLLGVGYKVKLYADSSNISYPCDQINNLKDADVFIYHHSIACDSGVAKFKELKCRKILKYHNITPPSFFPPGSQSEYHCLRGLDQIKLLLQEKCEVWADSDYNGKHLQEFSKVECKIIPPYNQSEMMENIKPDCQKVLLFDDWNTNIIMVGRIAANKNVIAAIDAFSQYKEANDKSRLIIVGDTGGSYIDSVRKRIKELYLDQEVIITGKVTLALLKAIYLIADCLLITSKHEGFCVPMVEAMSMNVPIVSSKACALLGTGGDAVHYAEGDDIPKAIDYVLNNKIEFIKKGRDRFYSEYSQSSVSRSLLEALSVKK